MNTQRKKPKYGGPWQIVAMILGMLLSALAVWCLNSQHEDSFKELELGRLGGGMDELDQLVLSTDLNSPQSQACFESASRSTEQKILWLGNSQLTTINQSQARDKTMVAMLHERLKTAGQYLVACSPPNANLQEHFLISHYLVPRIKPRVLILPVCYDDLRESGVREQMQIAFDDNNVNHSLRSSRIGNVLCDEHAERKATTSAPTAYTSTLDWSEAKLNTWLETHSAYWSRRGTYRSIIFVNLYYLRNTVLNIKADSVRRMIPDRMARNFEALSELFDLMDKNEIKVLVYIPPIRNDVKIPYDIETYTLFKNQIKQLADDRGYAFANLESEIPGEDWGTKDSTSLVTGKEIDFMHFTARGHERLSTKIHELLITHGMIPEGAN